MKRFITILAIFTMGLMPYISLPQNPQDIEQIFNGRGEVYFRFENSPEKDIHFLTNIISIDHNTSENRIYAYANKKGFQDFLNLNLNYELLSPPGSLIQPKMLNHVDIKAIDEWDFYPTYDAYIELMAQFEKEYPELCKVFSIGTSIQGRQLMMAKISANVNIQENEPRFLYTSSIHGDELTSYVLMLRLIEHLLKNYGTDEQVSHLLKNMEIWINPLANPDGTYAGGNNTVFGATRFNANNVDLNRNYPDPQNGPHPDGNAWQKETLEFMELADSVSFVMAANFHGGAEVFNYPWDTWAKLHADDDWWQLIGREWADTVHQYAPSNYFTGFNNGITNGYAWYEVNGGRQDYMNYFHHCREITLEISDIKLPQGNFLPEYWKYNYRSFLNYINQGIYGISGTVTDSGTGLPVKATVNIANHDKDESYVISDSLNGKYFRPLLKGNYDITWSAPKYASQTIEDISIENYQSIVQDIELVYSGAGIGEDAYSNKFTLGPNPATEAITINYSGGEILFPIIEISDITGKILRQYQVEFSSGNKKINLQLGGLNSGLYIVKIATERFVIVEKIIIK
jgi:hypothetical protein